MYPGEFTGGGLSRIQAVVILSVVLFFHCFASVIVAGRVSFQIFIHKLVLRLTNQLLFRLKSYVLS